MEGILSISGSHATIDLDRLQVVFDDHHSVASAGLPLPATLADQLSIEAATNELVHLDGSARAPGSPTDETGITTERRSVRHE